MKFYRVAFPDSDGVTTVEFFTAEGTAKTAAHTWHKTNKSEAKPVPEPIDIEPNRDGILAALNQYGNPGHTK